MRIIVGSFCQPCAVLRLRTSCFCSQVLTRIMSPLASCRWFNGQGERAGVHENGQFLLPVPLDLDGVRLVVIAILSAACGTAACCNCWPRCVVNFWRREGCARCPGVPAPSVLPVVAPGVPPTLSSRYAVCCCCGCCCSAVVVSPVM